MDSFEWGNFCLIINIIIWLFTFIIFQYKTKYFGVGSGILLFYSIISLLAWGLYNETFSDAKITLFPFIYLYGMIILAAYPILSIKERAIRNIIPPNPKLFKLVCIGIIAFSFVSLPNTIILIRENIFSIILDTTAGAELYSDKTAAMMTRQSSGINLIPILGGVCGNIAIVFFMYYLTLENRNKTILICLGISALIGPISGIANGGRAGMAMFLLNSSFLFLFIRKFISPNLKKKVSRIIVIAGIILLIPFFALSLSRNNGDQSKTLTMVESYLSQGFLWFNTDALDPGGTREGDYTAVAFKYIAGLKPAMYYSGRINKYPHLKIDESVFYSFVGDFTLDYGPIAAVVIFIVTAIFFKKCLHHKNSSITFQQYLMFYLLMVGCLGYFQFPLGREDGNLVMIGLLTLALIFKLSSDFDLRKITHRHE